MNPIPSPFQEADRLIAAAIAAVGAGSLAMALIAQYGFGLEPCILCLYQRVPYGVNILVGGLAFAYLAKPNLRIAAILFAGLVFLVGGAIAFYHVGVEEAWWAATTKCTGSAQLGGSLDDMLKAMETKPAARCDQVPWKLFGVSMAGYNFVFSLGLAGACLTAGRILLKRLMP